MKRRYVFWRMPDGRPYKETDGKHSPAALLAEFGRITDVTPDGKLSWQSFAFNRLETAIKFASVVISPDDSELNETDSWAIIRASLFDAIKTKGGKRPLISTEVLKAADFQAAKYFRNQIDNYRLISGLSVETLPFKRIKIAGCQIEALPSRRRYPFPTRMTSEADPDVAPLLEHSNNKLVLVRTSGRTHFDAVDAAFRALNLLRGLWSLFATYGAWSISYGSRSDPIAVIHAGPVHTLHYPNGKLATEMYWYERDLQRGYKLFTPKAGWKKYERYRRWALARLRRLPYRKDIENLIIRYQIALDQSDLNIAFLQMWSILEKLTDTIGKNYDETLKRAIWPFPDRVISKEILESIRLLRNLYVHAAQSTEAPDQAAYLLKAFVEPHLVALIRNDFGIACLEEYGQHLSLPSDLNTLERDRKRIARALQITRMREKAKALA
jgi:hypothetical protein